MGKGGSGKDHLRKILIEKGFKYCISHTTRPPRDGEENGRDYWFIQSHHLLSMVDDFYETVYFNDWFYGTTKKEFQTSNLFIMTPGGISRLNTKDRKESVVIYLNISEEIRRKRLEERRDADNVRRRIDADSRDFHNFTDFDYEIENPNFSEDSLTFIDEFFPSFDQHTDKN